MSIYKGNKKVVALYKGATPIIRRYKGTELIYNYSNDDEDDEPKNETLSFAWSGTSSTMQYRLNGTTYTASSNPFTTTLTDLGIDKFTNANTMFNSKRAITAVTSIPDTSNVTNMYYMFRYLGVSELNVTKTMNTSACTDMGYMFAYCLNLTSLDLSSFDLSNVKNMNMMFYNDTKLDYLDISGWDLRNVTSKSTLFGNGVKPTKIIMNGCDCDTILFIRQELKNNKLNHIDIVQTDTVCPEYEPYENKTYSIEKDIKDIAWNVKYAPNVNLILEERDIYGVTSKTQTDITNSCEFIYDPSDNNETEENRTVTVTIYYKGEYVSETTYKQLTKPIEVDGGFYLSCDSPKDVAISQLIIDMNDVSPVDGWYFARFSRTPNGYGDCDVCDGGDLDISLHENVIGGNINMEIKDLPMNDEGKYVLTFNEPYYFQCAEMNFPFNKVLCITNNNNISLRLNYPYEFNLYLNDNQYMINSDELTDNGDGTYTFTKDINEILGGEDLYSCTNVFSSINTRLVELISFPITSNVIEISGMFMGCSDITSLDLSNWDTSQIWNMRQLFYNCSALSSLDLSNWTITDNCDTESMFNGCPRLEGVYVKNCDETTKQKIQDALNRTSNRYYYDSNNEYFSMA